MSSRSSPAHSSTGAGAELWDQLTLPRSRARPDEQHRIPAPASSAISTSVSGASAREHAIAACLRLFDTAIADGHLQHNPAKAVRKPPRQESRRTALTHEQVAEVFGVVRDEETGLLTFLLETACRREGLLDLAPEKLHPARSCRSTSAFRSALFDQPTAGGLGDRAPGSATGHTSTVTRAAGPVQRGLDRRQSPAVAYSAALFTQPVDHARRRPVGGWPAPLQRRSVRSWPRRPWRG